MKQILIQAFIIGIVCGLTYLATGCSHTVLVGECHKVENQNKNACKTLKPWE